TPRIPSIEPSGPRAVSPCPTRSLTLPIQLRVRLGGGGGGGRASVAVAVLPSPNFAVRVKTDPRVNRLFMSEAKSRKLPPSGTEKFTLASCPLSSAPSRERAAPSTQ